MTLAKNAVARRAKLSVNVGPDMSQQDARVALGEIADFVKALRVAGKSSLSATALPVGCDEQLSVAIQALFAAQRLIEESK